MPSSLTESMMLAMAIGGVLLICGRHLFWLYVGVAGFLTGYNLAVKFMAGYDPLVLLFVGVVAGLTGVFLAVVMQRFGVVVAGFLTGGLIMIDVLTRVLNWSSGWEMWCLAGAVVGAVAGAVFFDWALIILSALLGSGIIVREFFLAPELELLLFTGLFVLGLLFQASNLKKT